MKTKKLLALILALLFIATAFVSCKKTPEDLPDDDDTVTQKPEEETVGLGNIFNLDWKPAKSETTDTITKATKLSADAFTNFNGSPTSISLGLVAYKDSTNSNVTRVYDYISEKEVFTVTDTAVIEGAITTFTKNHIAIVSEKSFAVLTVKYTNAPYINDAGTFDSDYFGYDIYYSMDYPPEYTISVYNTEDVSKPSKTFNPYATRDWVRYTYYDYTYGSGSSYYYEYENDLDKYFLEYIVKGSLQNISQFYNHNDYELIADDLLLVCNAIYRRDKEGNLTLVRSLGIDGISSYDYYEKCGDYYYDVNDYDVTVYDKDLKAISTYAVPSYCEDADFFILRNGDVLVQYTELLDVDTDTYDYMLVENYYVGTSNQKYDLHTCIISAATGEATEINASFVVRELENTYATNPDYANYYNAKLSNIAVINYIKNSKLDVSATACDVVSMNDKGEVVESLKLHNDWAGIPENLGNGFFTVYNVRDTYTVMDKTGKILNNNVDLEGQTRNYLRDYFVLDDGIYNMTGEKTYDLSGKIYDIYYVNASKNITLLSIVTDDGGFKYELFSNGTITAIGTKYFDPNKTSENLTLINCNSESYGYYTIIYDKTTGKYTYNSYNEEGTLLHTSENYMNHVASYNGIYIYRTTEYNSQTDSTSTVYYKFS